MTDTLSIHSTPAMTETTETARPTYLVPEGNLETLRAKVAKIAKRAKRLGFAPDAVRIVSEAFDHIEKVKRNVNPDDESGALIEGEVIRWFKIEIEAPVVKLNGWRFVATVAHTDEGNLLSAVPGETVPVRYRSMEPICEHCGTKRKRTETYVVAHEDGRDAMVGANCLRDFVGGHDAHRAAGLAELLGLLDTIVDELGHEPGGGWVAPTYGLDEFLAVTAMMIRLKGWVSRTFAKARNEEVQAAIESGQGDGMHFVDATASLVLDYINPTTNAQRRFRAECGEPVEVDREVAATALDWALGLSASETTLNDYEYNLNVIARLGVTTRKTSGLAASMVTAYRRAAGLIEKKEAAKKRHENSTFLGTAGERLKGLTVTIDAVIPIESEWGTKELVKFTDDAGNAIVWFNSGDTVHWERTDDRLHSQMTKSDGSHWRIGNAVGRRERIDATVKDHEVYNGVKQTAVSRVTCWSPEKIAEADAKAAKRAEREAKKTAKTKAPKTTTAVEAA